MTIPGFDKAQAQYDAAEPDDECQCPTPCDTCNETGSVGLYCCGQCQDDDGPDDWEDEARQAAREEREWR